MIKTAILTGPNDCYRVELQRIWNPDRPALVVGMLNPSDADAERNDPTVLTLCHFGQLWHYGGLRIVNEYSYRSPSPAVMRAAVDPVGPDNPRYVDEAMRYAARTTGWALAAWGNGGNNSGLLVRAAAARSVRLMCLGLTANGSPKHPLARGTHRIPRDQQPLAWRVPA